MKPKLGFVHFCTPPAGRKALMRNFTRSRCMFKAESRELKLRLKTFLSSNRDTKMYKAEQRIFTAVKKMPTLKKSAGFIYGKLAHHLDHIAPLCSLMQIPLIVTEEEIARAARQFYPGVEVIATDYLTAAEFLVSHFDIIFYSMPRDLFDEIFFFAQKLLQKKIHTVWCPHGNSDKGQSIFFMEALRKEESALVYGKQMIEFLQRKKAFDQLKSHVITGNYRYRNRTCRTKTFTITSPKEKSPAVFHRQKGPSSMPQPGRTMRNRDHFSTPCPAWLKTSRRMSI